MNGSFMIETGVQAFTLLIKWKVAVGAAKSRLAQNVCDFCFKLSENVQR